jgi:flagellar biogenesis protein FliO
MKFRIAITWAAAFLVGISTVNLGRAEGKTGSRQKAVEETKADELAYTPPEWPDPPDTAAMLRRVVVGTGIVLGLCVCTLYAGRRWLRGAPAGNGSGAALRLVETLSLGNRCSVHLLQTGEHQVLVGIDAGGLKSLLPLPPSFERAMGDAHSAEFEPAERVENTGFSVPSPMVHS